MKMMKNDALWGIDESEGLLIPKSKYYPINYYNMPH